MGADWRNSGPLMAGKKAWFLVGVCCSVPHTKSAMVHCSMKMDKSTQPCSNHSNEEKNMAQQNSPYALYAHTFFKEIKKYLELGLAYETFFVNQEFLLSFQNLG